MEKKSWLDFVSEKKLNEFFKLYNYFTLPNGKIKVIKDKKYGKILSIQIPYGKIDGDEDYQTYYLNDYGELRLSFKNQFEKLLPKEFARNENCLFDEFFPDYQLLMAKCTKGIKIYGKTYLQALEEEINKEIKNNFNKDLKNLTKKYEEKEQKLHIFTLNNTNDLEK